MYFTSDNWAGVHPKIGENLSRHSDGFAKPYGASPLDREIQDRFSEIFERDVAVFFVATGTAANALAVTVYDRPGGVALCHEEAHLIADECGAPEYFTGGGRLHSLPGPLGRIDTADLERQLQWFPNDALHAGQPTVVSLTQTTEIGTLYQIADIARVSAICREHGVALHMDGARFANALAALDASPADMTWRAGVDALSFGATKNGCWCAEALVLFDPDQARQMPFLRKRAGQLFSKSRFVSAQFEAYLKDGLWLEIAAHSNDRAGELAQVVSQSKRLRLAWQPQANEVFAVVDSKDAQELRDNGVHFADWVPPSSMDNKPGNQEILIRMVTSFATTDDDIKKFAALVA